MITIQEAWKTEEGKYKCPHCDICYTRKGIATHIWKKHGAGKDHKPFKNKIPWNKCLTTETDKRIAQGGRKISELQMGEKNHFYGKKHSEKTIKKMKANPNMGGAGRGGGRGKSGWYKGYWCDSSWELAYVIYNIEHGIEFKRNKDSFTYIHENVESKYFPDFIENGIYIEIKGYYDDRWISKYDNFKKPLKVLYKNDIKKYLEYVNRIYGKEFTKLYEGKSNKLYSYARGPIIGQ